MKKILFFALIFSSLMVSAQKNASEKGCMAMFKYAINTDIYTLLPATAINFYDKSEGNVVSWIWDFGDGNYSSEQNPLYIFNHPIVPDGAMVKINPYRTITLTVLTADSCKSFYSETINIFDSNNGINNICEARYKYYQVSTDSINNTATVQFNNYSSGENLNYFWDFGNGITSTETEQLVTFDLAQKENKVCLNITGDNGCSNIFCDAVYLFKNDENQNDIDYNNCFASFGYYINNDINTFAPSLTLNFYSKVYGQAEKYHWDFGDGNSSNDANPVHSFNLPLDSNIYTSDTKQYRTVCLSVTTSTGCETTYCETIDLFIRPDTIVTDNCHVYFKYYNPEDVITIPELIAYQFKAVSDKEISSIEWRFEDGSISKEFEPLKTFDIFNGKTYLCLSVTTTDGCSSQFCDAIYFKPIVKDTIYNEDPECSYKFKLTSSYPIWASSCVGKVKAEIVLNDSVVKPDYIYWSTGEESDEIENLCPTRVYTVTARVNNQCKLSTSFVFNADGIATEVPVNWWIWISYDGKDQYIECDIFNKDYQAEWIMCDGSVYYGESVPLDKFNCGTSDANLILRDHSGNVVYSETIAIKGNITNSEILNNGANLELYPNPVGDILNVEFSGINSKSVRFEIIGLNGKVIISEKLNTVNGKNRYAFDVSKLPIGLYVGKLLDGNNVKAVKKFIK